MLALDRLISDVLAAKGLFVVLVRNGQSMGNYAGSMVGWTDSKLSIKGREQSNQLFAGLHRHVGKFAGLYSSDVSRSVDTARLALGFPSRKIVADMRLRQINFGEDEGRHFDSLPAADKDRINSIDYRAPKGESWEQVRKRALDFYRSLREGGTHLVFTHGGIICTQTFRFGLQNVIPNASAVCLELDKDKKPARLVFQWEYPQQAAEQPL